MKTKTRNLLFSEVDSIKVIVIFFMSIVLTSIYDTKDYAEQERPISVVSELQINKNKTNIVLNIPIIRIGSGIR